MKKKTNKSEPKNPGLSQKNFAGILVFVALFVYAYSWIHQGLEVTDTGFSLTKQMLLVKGWDEYPFGMVWVSDLIGGIWQTLAAPLGMIGVRLGWCFLIGVSGLITFYFLNLFVPLVYSALLAVLVGIALKPSGLLILYYSNIPGPIIATAMIFLFLSSQQVSRSTSKAKMYSGLYCVLIITAFMARFPVILAVLILPLVPLISHWIFFKSVSKHRLKHTAFLYLGSFAVVLLFLLVIFLSGNLSEYFHEMKKVFGLAKGFKPPAHNSPGFLLQMYWQQFSSQVGKSILYVGILTGVHFITHILIQKRVIKSSMVLAALMMLLVGGFIFLGVEINNFKYLLFLPNFSLISALFAMGFCFFWARQDKVQAERYFLALALAVLAMFFSFGGSNNGFRIAILGMFLVLPLSLIVVNFNRLMSEKKKVRSGLGPGLEVLLAIAVISVFAYKAYAIRLISPYRDSPNRVHFTEELKFPKLKGIFTSKSRAETFGELLEKFTPLVKKGDTILVYNSIPLLYYLTETRPYLNDAWPALRGAKILEYFFELVKDKPLPEYVVRAKTNTQHPQWGMGVNIPMRYWVYRESEAYIDAWVKKQGYPPIWQNKDFVIFRR